MKLVQRNLLGQFARIWSDTSEVTDEHFCHVHPLGSVEVERYWCGHSCQDDLCLKYKLVWMATHMRAVIRHRRGLDYNGLPR